MIVAAILVFSFTILLSIKTWKSGDSDGDYKKVCIQGHTYYRSNFGNKMGLSIALNDEGRPIKCEVKND